MVGLADIEMKIRKATFDDKQQLWQIFQSVVSTGDTYVFLPDSDFSIFEKYWMNYFPFVAVENDIITGTYIIKPNQIGLGSHVANGSYMINPDFQGKGIGTQLGLHSLENAKAQGFKAMQFNFVVSTNKPAIMLWKKLGFDIIGTIPKAFDHQTLGFVDAHVMYKDLK